MIFLSPNSYKKEELKLRSFRLKDIFVVVVLAASFTPVERPISVQLGPVSTIVE